MKIVKLYFILSLILGALLSSGCDDSLDGNLPSHIVDIDVVLPADISYDDLQGASLEFRNLTTGNVQTFSLQKSVDVMPGLYDVSFSATVQLHDGLESQVKAFCRSVQVTSDHTLVRLETYRNIVSDDLIIAEIFFTGTLQTSGNSYVGDDYIKLYNNTDHVIYADGLTLFESKFLTTQKLDFTPDIMSTDVSVDALYTVPGSGTDYPVAPGEYLLIADTGIDHRTINPNSFDLSDARLEWYDVSTRPSESDIDSPTSDNMDKWYCYTQTLWMLHNRGYKAYGLARIPVGKERYLSDYYYNYDYQLVTAAGSFAMSSSAYRIPNDWIVDAVNCSVDAPFQWIVTAPALDCGWTGCGAIANDKTRYFKSVRRKLLYVEADGRVVLQDTNNSTDDFNRNCVPSEIELQNSVMGIDGQRATTITYDGVTPISAE